MTNYGDFSSLLQLGVGIGIGLSLFRAPVDLRLARISRTIDSELVALRDMKMPFARTKRRDIQDLKLKFGVMRDKIDRWILPFMVAAIVGAFLNLVALVAVTLCAEYNAGPLEITVAMIISIGWFLIELLALEVLARATLHSIGKELHAIRGRRAPGIQPLGRNSTVTHSGGGPTAGGGGLSN